MKQAFKDLDPEAIKCSDHPDMEYSSVSLDKNIAKWLLCVQCFDKNNSIPNLLPLRKIISLEAITLQEERLQHNKLDLSQCIDSSHKFIHDKVDQNVVVYQYRFSNTYIFFSLGS